MTTPTVHLVMKWKHSCSGINYINKIKMYHKNQMTLSYKIDEKILKNLVKITHTVLMIMKNFTLCYHKSKLTCQLIMTNNNEKKNKLNSTNVVYINSSVRTKTVCFVPYITWRYVTMHTVFVRTDELI